MGKMHEDVGVAGFVYKKKKKQYGMMELVSLCEV